MNIYVVGRDDIAEEGQFESFVCVAESLEDAITIHPYDDQVDIGWERDDNERVEVWPVGDFAIQAVQIGIASPDQLRGVVLASFVPVEEGD